MTHRHTVCLNRALFHAILDNSSRTRGAKYSHPVLITRLCKNYIPDDVFDSFPRVYVVAERPTSSYTGCLHALWTPSAQPEDIPVESSSEESLEEVDEPQFWRQDPPTESQAFMSAVWKGMKKIFRGQVRLRKKVEENSSRLDSIEAALRRSQSAGPSTTAGPKRQRGWFLSFTYFHAYSYLAYIGDNAWDRYGGVDANIGFFTFFLGLFRIFHFLFRFLFSFRFYLSLEIFYFLFRFYFFF